RFQGGETDNDSLRFDAWLAEAVTAEPAERERRLAAWADAPSARAAHPREEHLLPLHVVAGAAGADRGERLFADEVMGAVISGFRFGSPADAGNADGTSAG